MRAANVSVFSAADAAGAQVQAVAEAPTYLVDVAAGLSEQGLSVEVAVPCGDAEEAILLEVVRHSPLPAPRGWLADLTEARP